ncbi:MAG: type VII secretion protein EccB, partial [Streptomycetaceae bacterium]|nr:type VII secretion protein EccB [Streptomycetaceae bacterium]
CEKVEVAQTGAAVSARGVTSAVLAGEPQSSKDHQPLDDSRALLVSLDERTFLIHDGRRAEVDPDSSAVSRALGIRDVKARPIGLGLLNAAVAAPPIRPPSIPRAGEPSRVAGVKIGAVFTVPGIETHELYVAVAEGVQRISPLTAQIIRNANTVGETGIAAVSPDRLDGVPQVTPLPVTQFPRVAPQIVGADEAPVTCLTWTRDSSDGPARVQMRAGRRLPLDDTATPVRLAGADGAGARLDEVYVAPSSGEFVQVTGIERTSVRRDSLFYIGDNGIRYGIADRETAATLGLGDHPRQAPWAIVGRLPAGPTLRRDAALTAHDSLPQPAP